MKKQPLIIKRHKEIGELLFNIKEQLINVDDKMFRDLPEYNDLTTTLAVALGSVGILRERMDTIYRKNHSGNYDRKIYFPMR